MLFPTGMKLEVLCMLIEQICFVVFNVCKSVKDALVCTCWHFIKYIGLWWEADKDMLSGILEAVWLLKQTHVYIYIYMGYVYICWSCLVCQHLFCKTTGVVCSYHETSVCLHSLSLLNCLQGNGETVLNIKHLAWRLDLLLIVLSTVFERLSNGGGHIQRNWQEVVSPTRYIERNGVELPILFI